MGIADCGIAHPVQTVGRAIQPARTPQSETRNPQSNGSAIHIASTARPLSSARDGREAYQLLQKGGDFLACVFDVVMPHIQGPELVRYMRTERRLMKIPVMMMTAEQNPKLSSDSFAAGAVVFLPKPFTTSQLQIMLRMLISKAQNP